MTKKITRTALIKAAIFVLAVGINVAMYTSSGGSQSTSISVISAFAASTSPENNVKSGNQQPYQLPLILIHGWNENASVWSTWEHLLNRDGFTAVYPVTFRDSSDECARSSDHALELAKLIQEIKNATQSDKVNIVAHSKGGLDARMYLANGTKDVSNLIMIGTPNEGSPLAYNRFYSQKCTPGNLDLLPGAVPDNATINPNTNYYTIGGNWLPYFGGNPEIAGPDDGLVPLDSAEPSYFYNLGTTGDEHNYLLGPEEYELARPILLQN